MSVEIQGLEFEIGSNSASAAQGLDALRVSLEKLKTITKGGAGLASFSKQLKPLATVLNTMDGSAGAKLKELAAGLAALSSLSGFKLSSSIATQLTNIGIAVRGLNGVGFNKLTELASALAPLSTVGNISLTNVFNQLVRLPAIATELMTVDTDKLRSILSGVASALNELSTVGKSNLGSALNQLEKLPAITALLSGMDASGDLDTFAAKIAKVAAAMKPLADEMQKVSAGFSSFPSKIQKLISSTNKLSASTGKTTKSFFSLASATAMLTGLYFKLVRVANILGSLFNKSNEYIEVVNLAKITMREASDAAIEFANRVETAMGIDSVAWLKSLGTFNQMMLGFGIGADAANEMSQQLTQLAYDIQSVYDVSDVSTVVDKLQSGISGQIKGMRDYGVELSIASLQEYALSKGITQTVRSMNQAQKSMLRYMKIMDSTKNIQGDLARTILTPANSLRILKNQWEVCKRQMGNVVSVIAVKVIPWFQALIQIITEAAQALAAAWGFELPEIDYSGLDTISWGTEDIEDDLDGATDSAKALKNALMGFDELNVISPNTSDNADSGSTAVGDLWDIGDYNYDFLSNIDSTKIDEIKEKLKDILWLVGEIAVGLLAWKLSASFLGSIGGLISSIGLVLLIDSIRCTLQDGLNIKSIIEAAVGGALMGAAIGFKLGGWSGAIGGAVIGIGLALSIVGITSMFADGVNIKNTVTTAVGLGLAGAGIGFKLGGWGTAIGGFVIGVGVTLLISGIKSAIDEGVNVGNIAEIIGGALSVVAGIMIAVKLFNSKVKNPAAEIQTATDSIESVSTGTSALTSKLKNLAKNLALGLVILVEVAAAAILVVGAVWVLGKELEQVAIAWQPVIDNGETVAIAMGIGVALLAGIGVVTALLGSVGTTLIVNLALGIAMLALIGVSAGLFIAEIWAIGWGLEQIGIAWQPVLDNGETIAIAIGIGTALLIGIGAVCALLGVAAVASAGLLPLAIGLGTAMLLELGVAALLFIAEIWAIGKGLDEIGQAWQPVIDNGDTIKIGIEVGTALLIAIGVVTAALGVAAVASVGLLPLAIALGTAMLVELTAAFIVFTENLIIVANQLADNLHPALNRLNEKIPDLSNDMASFTDFFIEFAENVVRYSASSIIASIAATIDKIIDFFTTDPIQRMSDDAYKQYNQSLDLISKLKLAIPKIEEATTLLKDYKKKVEQLQTETNKTDIGSIITIGISLVTKGWEGAKNLVNSVIGGVEKLVNGVIKGINTMINALNKLSFDVPDWVPIIGGKKFGFNLGTISTISIPRLATGGVVGDGQMFVAREAGAELVGNIGNKTTVMNNDQIVESVSQGVYEAVVAAMAATSSQSSANSGEVSVKVYLDSKEITAAVEKRQRERGVSVLGGVVYG